MASTPHAHARRIVIRVLAVTVAVAACAAIAGYQVWPYRGIEPGTEQPLPLATALTREQALADLEYAYASVRDRHMATAHGVPEALARRYEEVRAAVPAEPTVLDVWRGAARLANVLADAHTGVNLPATRPTTARFAFDGSTLRLNEPGNPVVLALNGVPVSQLWGRFQQLASYESPQAAVNGFAGRVRFEPWLRLLGAPAAEGVTATLESGTRALPLGEAPSAGPRPPEVRFERDLAILVLHDCSPGPVYTQALDALFDGARDRGIGKVVVDLRDNGGGDSAVANEFVGRLDVAAYRDGGVQQRWGPWVFTSDPGDHQNDRVARPYAGRVFVLTSSATFSSAVIFTWLLQDNHLATVVGQSPSNNPNAYGDTLPLRLPNSRLRWVTTYKLFTRASGDTDPTRPLVPDIVTLPGAELDAVAAS